MLTPFAARACCCAVPQILNVYVDQLSTSRSPKPARVEFFIKSPESSTGLRRIEARLTPTGNLAPLFHAFGLINAEQLAAAEQQHWGDGNGSDVDVQDTNFLFWLREQVSEAVRTAEQHELLKMHIRKLKASLEEAHLLAGIHVSACLGAATMPVLSTSIAGGRA